MNYGGLNLSIIKVERSQNDLRAKLLIKHSLHMKKNVHVWVHSTTCFLSYAFGTLGGDNDEQTTAYAVRHESLGFPQKPASALSVM